MTVKFSQFSDGNEVQVGDEVVGLRSSTNTRFDFPGAGIKDASGYYLVAWTSPGGVVTNYVEFTSAITSTNPIIGVTGDDSDISLTITTKNNGDISLDPAGSGYVYAVGTNAFVIPAGTTAQQPVAPPDGSIRYNTTTDLIEFWDTTANAWTSLGVDNSTADYITQTDQTTDLPNSVPLSGLSTGIIAVTTGTGAIAGRTITGTSNRIDVSNGDGSGNPTIDISATYTGQSSITTVGTLTELQVDNININGNTISSTDTNGNINLAPDGTGLVDINSTTGVDGVIDDDTMATASATTLATSESIKAYVDGTASSTFSGYFNCLVLEDTDISVTSDGATWTLSLEQNGGGDLTISFSTGLYTFDSTPAATVTLTAGTDTVPVENYVYIPISTKTLTASSSSWPSEEYVAVATVVCQSAASGATDGAYKVHGWHDDVTETIGNGHSTALNFWIRSQNATWISGTALTPTVGVATFTVAVSTGIILQLHQNDFPAFDTSSGSVVFVPNDNTTAYDRETDLTNLLTDANGASMSNRRFNLVFWGVVSEDSTDCKLFVNLPTDSYNADDAAIEDTQRTSVFTIPSIFKGTGFLISRLTVRHVSSSNTWSILQNEDLRGLVPATATGSGTGGITAVVEDPTPELGGNLDALTLEINNVGLIDIDNITIDGNTISSTDTNGNINLDPDGTGLVVINSTTGVDGIIDDDSMATASATTLATSESIKAYVDASGGGSSETVTKDFNQTTHGLSVGDWIYNNAGTFTKAIATSAAAAEVVGVVSAVADANNFTLQISGYVSGLSSLTADTVYFLSTSTAGAIQSTEPSTVGQVSKPLLVSDSTTSGIMLTYRGNVVSDPDNSSGTVINTQTTTKSDTFSSSTATAWTDVTGLSVTITPSSSSNTVLIMGHISSIQVTDDYMFRIVRDSTAVGIGDSDGANRTECTIGSLQGITNNNGTQAYPFFFEDSPATTSATTYKIQFFINASGTLYVNRSTNDTDSDNNGRAISTIIAQEVVA